ncbi:MAG: hypothetical protein KF764_08255 [Labilithrix sp.]|nr:hypothetical protein [Labilithrix sp.]
MMNVERVRALWKKAMPYALAVCALGAAGTAALKYKHAQESCCAPGKACCYPGSPCCNHADSNRVSQR